MLSQDHQSQQEKSLETWPPARVLVVDQSDDTRDVLRTILERQGVEFLEALTAPDGLQLLRQHHPNVVVLDVEVLDRETDAANDMELRAEYDRELAAHQTQMVILGNLRQEETILSTHHISKPYHYRSLIQKIEGLVRQNVVRQNATSTCHARPQDTSPVT